jgi:hypothetical protein
MQGAVGSKSQKEKGSMAFDNSKMRIYYLMNKAKTPTLLRLLRDNKELVRLLITSTVIFFKYRIVNKKMIVRNFDEKRSFTYFVRNIALHHPSFKGLFYEQLLCLSHLSRDLCPQMAERKKVKAISVCVIQRLGSSSNCQ